MNCIENMVVSLAAHGFRMNGGQRNKNLAVALEALLPEDGSHESCDHCSTDGDYGQGLASEVENSFGDLIEKDVRDWSKEFKRRGANHD